MANSVGRIYVRIEALKHIIAWAESVGLGDEHCVVLDVDKELVVLKEKYYDPGTLVGRRAIVEKTTVRMYNDPYSWIKDIEKR